jgi:tetratricopeptide (TPR) repeat protein
VDLLCDRRHAVTVKEISQRCFITHQTASSQLKKLLEMGYVRSESIGRESLYELREVLMRFCLEVKKQRGEPISLIVDLLRIWYTRTELQERLELLPPDATLEREYVLHVLNSIEKESEDPRVVAYLEEYSIYINEKNYALALQVTEKLLEICNHPTIWYLQALCLFTTTHHEEALASFDKYIKFDSDDALAWYFRSATLFMLDRFDEALTSSEIAIKLNPNDDTFWLIQGIINLKLQYFEQALSSLEKAIKLNPNRAENWWAIGVLLSYMKGYKEAVSLFEKSIEFNPDYGPAWTTRGFVLGYLRFYQEALVSFDKAIELGEQSSTVFFNRAKYLLALNRWDEGIAALDDALNRFAHTEEPDTGDEKAILRNLFNSTNDVTIWRSRIKTLIELYDKHQVLSALGKGLVESIPAIMSEMVSDKAAQTWL